MLVEMAVADAYAIPWEFTDQQKGANDLTTFYQHPTYLELTPGQYTDDTQRAIANIDVMLSGNPLDAFNPYSYAESYVRAYHRDPREGYSRGYQALLKDVSTGGQFLQTINKTKLSNGSVMGVAPLGFIKELHGVKMAATVQAITTHHPETAVDAQIVALAVHYFVHVGGSRRELISWLVENVDWSSQSQTDSFVGAARLYSVSYRKSTIRANSISAYMTMALTNYNRLSDIIKDAVMRGGDTDSAAAVAVAVASCCPEIVNDIPQQLIDMMDAANPGFGVQYMRDLETALRASYG